ncbi:hypothetical protein M569_14231, partial [Genlisea aurea]
MESPLVRMCIESATESDEAVEIWRRQRRTIERMPSHLAEALFQNLLRRRLVFPALLEVFKYSIEEMDLTGENHVDAEWTAYLGSYNYLRRLVLADCNKISNSAIWSLAGMENLKEVDLSRCSKITDAGIKHLLSIPTIEKLCISGTSVTAAGVSALSSLTNLQFLDLGGLPVTDMTLSSFQALTKLQHMDLWGTQVSNVGVAHLVKLPSLHFLNLAWTKVTYLPNLPSLVCLDMSNCTVHSLFEGQHVACLRRLTLSGSTLPDISELFLHIDASRLSVLDLACSAIRSFSFLLHTNQLTELNLSGCRLDDHSVQHIISVGTSLRYLNLSDTQISSQGVEQMAGMFPNLETLLLSGTAVDDVAVPYISSMSSLKEVDLSNTNLKGCTAHLEVACVSYRVPSFSALNHLWNLERLNLEGINLHDAAAAAISSLADIPKLSHLFLRSFSLTDDSLHRSCSLPNLIRLGFRDAVATDVGLGNLCSPPPSLRVLDLRGCWLLSGDGLVSFGRKHSRVEVRHELV